ncbi:MAG: carbon-nitrogen hydrolase family protein [Calditrichaeota bacterium]|nr:MAG: carbon-nitrogen hydrolase family protein [Calditrichota bacterium]MBL1204331.1 carbon-nitrogen hydrolase family protein [Calditrichota bacterium]NOG44160.1 carbon-nitrogen hydrolase family protein [Calditrichota bacterium]
MKIALVQQKATENREVNRKKGIQAVEEAAKNGAEIVAFAELAFERFYPQLKASSETLALSEPVDGETVRRFQELARTLKIVIVLNIFEKAGNKTFDTSPVIDTDGKILGKTQMVHITDYEYFHERGYYAPGEFGAPVYNTAYGKIGVAICYDRHYPEYMRALALNGAEIVFIPQAGSIGEWPDGLYEAEMRVAAFQNGYFTALCNRVGKEEKLTFAGESFVCNPAGEVIARAGMGTEEILYADINLDEIKDSNAHKLFLRDRRPELYAEWFSHK